MLWVVFLAFRAPAPPLVVVQVVVPVAVLQVLVAVLRALLAFVEAVAAA